MLGKLFNLNAGGAGQPSVAPELVSTLESVQEDVHTRNLLYPDTQALYQHRHDQVFPLLSSPHLPATGAASAFDYDGDIDLDMRDVRVVVMQDVLSSIPSCVLYDSQPPPPKPTSVVPDRPSTMAGLSHLNFNLQEPSRRIPTSPRKPSLGHTARPLVIQPDSPQLRQSTTFDRRPSLHSRSQSRLETDAQRAYREYTDELLALSNCMFGNSELIAYRGTSTKLHVLPSESRPDISSSMFHDGRGSLGRSSMRSSKLSQSFSSESAAMFPPPPTSSSSSIAGGFSRAANRTKVLITRLFPITLPSDDDNAQASPAYGRLSEEDNADSSSGYPFPAYGDDGSVRNPKKKKSQLKQKRTPMYAIGLIINLPQVPPISSSQTTSASRSTFRGPGSYSEQESFPSSYGSGKRVGLSMAATAIGGSGGGGGGLGIDMPSTDSAAAHTASSSTYTGATDQDERKDPLTQHWDIIMRTLTQMQATVSSTVCTLLRAVDVTSPDPYASSMFSNPSRRASVSGRRSDDGTSSMKAPKTNAKLLTLMPHALMDMDHIAREADGAKVRIVVGLRALRVVTGQNRWGIWRDEARWVSRWAMTVRNHLVQQQMLPVAAQRRHDDFLYSLLTAFLATHTDWLQALSPASYRKRHLLLQASKGNDVALPARTIIVAHDRAAARRLIFLLSAFLPSSQAPPSAVRMHRSSTSMSWSALSQSPPSSFVVPILKEESLRRKINRRGGGSGRKPSHSRNLSFQGLGSSGSVSAPRSVSTSVVGAPAPLAHLNIHKSGGHERRPSDTSSIRTANLPISGNDVNTRKSSAATMTAVTSETSVAHFATLQRSESALLARPDSSASSVAADDLKRTLQRGDSNSSQYSQLLQQQLHGSASGSSSGADSRSQSSRWGSVLSGFLSGRRRDSTNDGSGGGHSRNSSTSSWDPRGRGNAVPSSPTKLRRGSSDFQPLQPPKQPQLPPQPPANVNIQDDSGAESSMQSPQAAKRDDVVDPHTPRLPYDGPNLLARTRRGGPEPFHRTPDPEGAYESPMKTSINPDDGVIDVDIEIPDYIRSFETAVSSPSSSGFLSTPGIASGLDAFEQSCRVSVDGDLPTNVAGWLQTYDPDFLLQAVPAQSNLLEQVKESLRVEPSPSFVPLEPDQGQPGAERLSSPQQARWVDVSSAIIVDTANLTVTRLQYRRLLRPKSTGEPSTPNSGGSPFMSSSAAFPTPTPGPVQETQLDEKFVQENIVTKDSVLSKAIERVMNQGSGGGLLDLDTIMTMGDSTDFGSKEPSRSTSNFRDQANSESFEPESSSQTRPRSVHGPSAPALMSAATLIAQEVPRAECKGVILSALEEIVHDVVETQHDRRPELEPSILRSAVKSWLESVDMGEI